MKLTVKTPRVRILSLVLIVICNYHTAVAQNFIFKPVYKHLFLHNSVERYAGTVHIDLDKKIISAETYDYDLSNGDFNDSKYDPVKHEYFLRVKEPRGSAYTDHYWILRTDEQGAPLELTQYISYDRNAATKDVSYSMQPPVVTAKELFIGKIDITGVTPEKMLKMYSIIDTSELKQSFNTFTITADSVIWDFQGNDSMPDFTKRMAIDSVVYSSEEHRHYVGFLCSDPDHENGYLEIQYGIDESIVYRDRDTRRPVIMLFVHADGKVEKLQVFLNPR